MKARAKELLLRFLCITLGLGFTAVFWLFASFAMWSAGRPGATWSVFWGGAPVAAAPVEWDGKCLGRPGDAGRIVYWMGPPYQPNDFRGYGTRYVCVDHGPENDGFWFEARPRDRYLP